MRQGGRARRRGPAKPGGIIMDYTERLTERQQSCGEVADRVFAEVAGNHAKDYNAYTEYAGGQKMGFVTCMCGRVFHRPQALGQHVAAVQKAAWKAWNEAWVGEWDRQEMARRAH